MDVMFHCDKCGLCCMHIGIAADYPELDRGDGICKYLDCTTRLCMIYNERPLLCNVDKAYHVFFKDQIGIEEYYKLNYKACKELKQKADTQPKLDHPAIE